MWDHPMLICGRGVCIDDDEKKSCMVTSANERLQVSQQTPVVWLGGRKWVPRDSDRSLPQISSRAPHIETCLLNAQTMSFQMLSPARPQDTTNRNTFRHKRIHFVTYVATSLPIIDLFHVYCDVTCARCVTKKEVGQQYPGAWGPQTRGMPPIWAMVSYQRPVGLWT